MPDTVEVSKAISIHLLQPMLSLQQAIKASHKLLTAEQPKCHMPGYKRRAALSTQSGMNRSVQQHWGTPL